MKTHHLLVGETRLRLALSNAIYIVNKQQRDKAQKADFAECAAVVFMFKLSGKTDVGRGMSPGHIG